MRTEKWPLIFENWRSLVTLTRAVRETLHNIYPYFMPIETLKHYVIMKQQMNLRIYQSTT